GSSVAATVHYARSVSQVYGLGAVLESDVVGGGYGVTTRRGFRAGVEVFRGWFAQPGIAAAGRRIESNGSTLLLVQPMGRRFGVEAQVFARRTNTLAATIPSRGALVSLVYRY
ncbi:MAG: hypothetical protein HOQ09_02930, partial [Gemmatimonadaceae bacterium]|nr:hypothetical protein [Gemmatimonadaceae bacterium]